ncbi:hypothetical protein Prudu_003441 [Prunus dulcis]|uniref:Protein FAM33A n=1 Tax=Prunus dulcis TaxID=3755 RepID=A0A4Y1QT62_PRUDU|nr:hypothetical protein Prudu_003441 [Prunus dulcis]
MGHANHDLTVVQHRLEREFQQIYPENANPMKLVSRIKKIQEELSTLEEQCRELLSAKQDLIDQARTTLVGNRNLVQRMEASMGISPNTDSEDSAFANFNQIIDEWTVQVRSKTGGILMMLVMDEKHDSDSEDINQLLFSAIGVFGMPH